MATTHIHHNQEEKAALIRKRSLQQGQQEHSAAPTPHENPLVGLQNQIGNAGVQRLLAQRSGEGPTELDDETAGRINGARGGGQSLDGAVQQTMSGQMGYDFSGVRVHTSSEANDLNEQLSAKAFTTGQDIFFRDGAYSPNSSSGQELLAHELTHVVQQSSGAVESGDRMQVNAPGDRFEREADSVAKQVGGMTSAPQVQRATPEEDDMPAQMALRKELDGAIQAQAMPEDEEEEVIQEQEMDEEDDELQAV